MYHCKYIHVECNIQKCQADLIESSAVKFNLWRPERHELISLSLCFIIYRITILFRYIICFYNVLRLDKDALCKSKKWFSVIKLNVYL